MFFHPGECLLSGTTALTTTRRLQICLLERILHFPPTLKGFPQLFLLNAPKTFSSDAFLSSKCFAAASQSWPACQRLRMAKPVFLASFLLLCFFYASANTLLIKCMFMYSTPVRRLERMKFCLLRVAGGVMATQTHNR